MRLRILLGGRLERAFAQRPVQLLQIPNSATSLSIRELIASEAYKDAVSVGLKGAWGSSSRACCNACVSTPVLRGGGVPHAMRVVGAQVLALAKAALRKPATFFVALHREASTAHRLLHRIVLNATRRKKRELAGTFAV
jgi:hypothetical protein